MCASGFLIGVGNALTGSSTAAAQKFCRHNAVSRPHSFVHPVSGYKCPGRHSRQGSIRLSTRAAPGSIPFIQPTTTTRFASRSEKVRSDREIQWFRYGPFVIWLVLFLAASASIALVRTQIADEIKMGLPIERRPSWQMWRVKRFRLRYIRRHRAMYPASRLRKWLVALVVFPRRARGGCGVQ